MKVEDLVFDCDRRRICVKWNNGRAGEQGHCDSSPSVFTLFHSELFA